MPADAIGAWATDVSSDGNVIVGTTDSFTEINQAWRWTELGGFQNIGVPAGARRSLAGAISGNGLSIVGFASFNEGAVDDRAWLWTSSLGMVDLRSLLVSRGADLTGWQLRYADSISADGTVIAGRGFFNHRSMGWVAVIPAPSHAFIVLAAAYGANRQRRRRGV
jgi:uncharacterized membrane protein